MSTSLRAMISSMADRLSERDRVLLGLLALVAIGLVCFIVFLTANRSLSAIEAEVNEQALLLDQMRESATKLRESLEVEEEDEASDGVEASNYTTELLDHATKSGMAETDVTVTPEPDEAVGAWIRNSVKVSLRSKPLGELANFWSHIANDRAKFPVAITKLNVRRRRNKEDAYDVEMIVSTYRLNKERPETKNGAKGAKKSGRSKS